MNHSMISTPDRDPFGEANFELFDFNENKHYPRLDSISLNRLPNQSKNEVNWGHTKIKFCEKLNQGSRSEIELWLQNLMAKTHIHVI